MKRFLRLLVYSLLGGVFILIASKLLNLDYFGLYALATGIAFFTDGFVNYKLGKDESSN